MSDVLTPIKPDYSKAWVRGEEYIDQEGTTFWRRLREERGWSREDVWQLTDGVLDPARQMQIEGEYGIGMVWELGDLLALAHLYGESPGALFDRCYCEKGQELLDEEARDG